MANKVKQGKHTYWIGPDDVMVAEQNVSADEKKREEIIEKLFTKAMTIHNALAVFKAEAFKLINDYMDEKAADSGVDWKQRGVTMIDFADNRRLAIKAGKGVRTDDPQLQIAKQLIDTCIQAWGEKSDRNLVSMVQTLWKSGASELDVRAIHQLMRFKVEGNEAWEKAMRILDLALSKAFTTKQYLVISYRDPTGKIVPVTLNLSKVGTDDEAEVA
jgi:hypothetical protein